MKFEKRDFEKVEILTGGTTLMAIEEARAGIGVKYFSSASEMFQELDNDEGG